MKQLITLLFAFLLPGFSQTDKPCLDYFFYDLPIDKDAFTIRKQLVQDKNFILTHNEKSFFHVRRVRARIENMNTCLKLADSANIELRRSWFYYRTTSKRSPYFKEVCVTYFFKTDELKNAEFDTIEKILVKKYKLNFLTNATIKSDGPDGKDTILEVGKRFLVSGENKYPEIELNKNNTGKKHHYITLSYKDLY